MIVFLLLLVVVSAEILIYKEDSKPVEIEIARRRLLKVQWPTVMAYVSKPDDDDAKFVSKFLECIKESKKNCSLTVGREMLSEYTLTWVPDTVFQLAVMLILRRDYMIEERGVVQLKKEVESEVQQVIYFNGRVNGAKDLSAFLLSCVEYGRAEPLNKLYFETVSLLNLFDEMKKSFWDGMVDRLVKDIMALGGFRINMESYSDWMNMSYVPLFKHFIGEEMKAAESNLFLLIRGTKGIDLEVVFGEGTLRKRSERVQAMDFPNMKYSISLASRLLDGSMFDFGKTGARTLEYIGTKGNGYLLKLKMSEYLDGLISTDNATLLKILYIPPLCSIGGLLGKGEFFHARTKFGMNGPEGGVNGERPKELMDRDLYEGLGIFRDQSVKQTEWLISLLNLLNEMHPIMPNGHFEMRKRGQLRLYNILKEGYEQKQSATFYQFGGQVFTTTLPIPNIPYQPGNENFQMLKDSNSWNSVIIEAERSLAFAGWGRFVQFWDFIYYADDTELREFLRAMSTAISPRKSGYQILIDCNASTQTPQHFYAQILAGMPASSFASESQVANFTYDGGIGIKILKREDTHFIFEITKKGKLYSSLLEFVTSATAFEMRKLGEAIVRVAGEEGWLEKGYRIYNSDDQGFRLNLKSF